MTNCCIREWEYLPIMDLGGGQDTISRAQADRLLSVARLASRRLNLGAGEHILFDGHTNLRAGQVVGLIVAGGVTLEILPKIDEKSVGRTRENLVRMLARSLNLPIADGELSQLGTQAHDLLEVLIGLFCRRLFDALRRGLPRHYVSHEDDLRAMRGRLDLVRQFTTLAAMPQKLACRFEELSPDISTNRIMKTAVMRLRRLARTADNQRRLIELEFAFADVTEVQRNQIPWDRVIIDRTNRAWADLLALAKLLLGDRFQTTSSGAALGFSLLFEMNTLFEEFVGRTLQATLPRERGTVTLQGPKRHALTDLNGTSRFAMYPDIVIQGPCGDWIIDTKWKRLKGAIDNPKHGVSQADVYQMMAYANVYRCKNLVLLYPYHEGLDREAGWIADFAINETQARLVIASVDLSHISSVSTQLAKIVRSDILRFAA